MPNTFSASQAIRVILSVPHAGAFQQVAWPAEAGLAARRQLHLGGQP